jgi:hypothetical protein
MIRPSKTHTQGEAFRYLANAREILGQSPIEGNIYLDKKPVREAFGTAYLAILEAINEYMIEHDIAVKQLPKSVEGYRAALQKYLAVHNGKLLREFDSLYDALHIAGYYRGLITDTVLVKDALKSAEKFIKKIIPQG